MRNVTQLDCELDTNFERKFCVQFNSQKYVLIKALGAASMILILALRLNCSKGGHYIVIINRER